jgi:hypothetical protein
LKAENAKFRRQNLEPYPVLEEVEIKMDYQANFAEMEGD